MNRHTPPENLLFNTVPLKLMFSMYLGPNHVRGPIAIPTLSNARRVYEPTKPLGRVDKSIHFIMAVSLLSPLLEPPDAGVVASPPIMVLF